MVASERIGRQENRSMAYAWWSLLLLAIGFGCLFLEIFIPSAGILGFLATTSLISAVVVGYLAGFWEGTGILVLITLVLPFFFAIAIKIWPHTPLGRMIILKRPESQSAGPTRSTYDSALHALLGRRGIAKCDMHPSGAVSIEGRTYDALTDGLPIEAGEAVKVVDVQMRSLIVRRDEGSTDATSPPSTPGAVSLAPPTSISHPEPPPRTERETPATFEDPFA